MTEDSLEQKLADRPTSNSGNLEEKVHEEKGFFGKLFDYSVALTAVGASYYIAGVPTLFAHALSFFGDKFKNWTMGLDSPSRQVRDSAIMTSIFSPIGVYFFEWINKIVDVSTWSGILKRAAIQLLAFPAVITPPALGLDYLIRHKKIEGIYEKGIKPYAWPFVRDNTVYFGVPNMLAAVYTPPWSHYYISGAFAAIRRVTIGQRHIHELDPYANEHEIYRQKNGKS